MKVRMELKPDEPIVVVVEIPDDKVTPELRRQIEEKGDEVPFDTGELPGDLEAGIDWDEVPNVHWVVDEIEIVKPKPKQETKGG